MNIILHIPENLDLKVLLIRKSHTDWVTSYIRFEKLLYLVNLFNRPSVHRTKTYEGFIPLNHGFLQKIIGSRYSMAAIRILIRCRVIECINEYDPNKGLSKRYRLSRKFRSSPCKDHDASERLSKRIYRFGKKPLPRHLARLKAPHRFIRDNLQKITFHPNAHVFLDCLDRETRGKYRHHYRRIVDGQWYFNVSRLTHRVTHNVTQLPKKLRNYVLLDGMPTAEVDIKCSQPFFLYSLCPRNSDEAKEERARFGEAVATGSFYEFLNAHSSRPRDLTDVDARSKLKVKIYEKVLFGKWNLNRNPLLRTFIDLFPILARKIRRIKQRNHTCMTRRLQRNEAKIMIENVVEGLRTEHPRIKVISIHDCLLCRADEAELMREFMCHRIERAIGLRPKVEIKWNDPSLPVAHDELAS